MERGLSSASPAHFLPPGDRAFYTRSSHPPENSHSIKNKYISGFLPEQVTNRRKQPAVSRGEHRVSAKIITRKNGKGAPTGPDSGGRRKGDKLAGAGTGGQQSRGGATPAPVAHRFTKDLSRAESLAAMLAHSRAASAVEVADLLAGMYIYDWERLSKYWPEQDAVSARSAGTTGSNFTTSNATATKNRPSGSGQDLRRISKQTASRWRVPAS
jgi:hypothetical protein